MSTPLEELKERLGLTDEEVTMMLYSVCQSRDFMNDDRAPESIVEKWDVLLEKMTGKRVPLYWEPEESLAVIDWSASDELVED